MKSQILKEHTLDFFPEHPTGYYGDPTTSRSPSDVQSSYNVDPVSKQVRELFQIVVFVSICGTLSLFGIGANIINIIVFVRQGFKESINISLLGVELVELRYAPSVLWINIGCNPLLTFSDLNYFLGLALADLGCALTMFWMSVGFNPLLTYADLNFNPHDVVYLTGGWPHACFNRITSYVTTFITIERCLCITIPLRIKDIINPFRTKLINIVIFLVMMVLFTPFYFVNTLEWIQDPNNNRTILSLVYGDNRISVETATFPIHSFLLPVIALLSVTFSTVVLIAELKKQKKWRQKSVTHSISNSEITSVRDGKIVKMVILIAVIYITCYTPATVVFFIMAYNPDFSFTGKYVNVFYVVWSFTALAQTISFSINIVVYYFMSSKFKSTFHQIICSHQGHTVSI